MMEVVPLKVTGGDESSEVSILKEANVWSLRWQEQKEPYYRTYDIHISVRNLLADRLSAFGEDMNEDQA